LFFSQIGLLWQGFVTLNIAYWDCRTNLVDWDYKKAYYLIYTL